MRSISKSKKSKFLNTVIYIIVFFISIWFVTNLVMAVTSSNTQSILNIKGDIPKVYNNIEYDNNKVFYINSKNEKIELKRSHPGYILKNFDQIEHSHKDGILIKTKTNFGGKVFYGLYPNEESKIQLPVFFKKQVEFNNNQALINIRENLSGKYDLANWQENKKGKLAYKIVTSENEIIYYNSVNFELKKDTFIVLPTITIGPFISNLSTSSATIWFETNRKTDATLVIDNKTYKISNKSRHEFNVEKLNSNKVYKYKINIGSEILSSNLKTAPKSNEVDEFTFAFASDSRAGIPLGESDAYGHNALIMKKISALISNSNAEFFQFTGDMINGYSSNKGKMELEYKNWLKTVSPFFKSKAINIGMGNHESFVLSDAPMSVNNFPFETNSSEALFNSMVANPKNGPESEDGSKYDPDDSSVDFPPYSENVYSYKYGNSAFLVLNSNYLYTPDEELVKEIGGNIHGYIMDNQLKWIENKITVFEKDSSIKHIFATIHTPAFPVGGHANNDMWYFGNNEYRPYINGEAAEFGIIERRDQLLDILVNKSNKFRLLLTGDEHNYSRLHINNKSNIYPENYDKEKIKFKREFIQIVNGAAGAPYYAMEDLPWKNDVRKFSPQFAVVFISVKGEEIYIKVKNPDTLEIIEEFKLR